MLNNAIRNSMRFVFLVLLQGLVLNQIDLGGYLNPYLYLMFLLMLPFETPKWLLLILGFVTGIVIDAFTNTLGMHTSACVLLAFVRPYLLQLIAPREGYEFGMQPFIQHMGLAWYITYAGILVLVHHSCFFFLEVFRFSDFFTTLLRILGSGAFTLLLIILSQYLIFKPRES